MKSVIHAFDSGENVLARLSKKLSGEDDLGNSGMYYTRGAHRQISLACNIDLCYSNDLVMILP